MPSATPLLLLALLALPGRGLDIRAYDPAVHDRFTGFSGAPVMNPGFLYDATRFTGIGWASTEGHKQFTMVSPRHFLFAVHAAPVVGQFARFVASDGRVVERTITAVTPITSDTSGNSDLMLGTLDSALPPTVKPLPYLNLDSEGAYIGESLIVFGFTMKAGNGSLLNVDELDPVPLDSNGPTRACKFNYLDSGSDPNNCHFFTGGGDSGSPSFAMRNGQPALVGLHMAVISVGGIYSNIDIFVPHYAAKLNTAMAPLGHRMRPAIFTAGSLSFTSSAAPAIFKSGSAATLNLALENTGAASGNLAVTLSFPAAIAPASVSAAGCVVEPLPLGRWSVRKAALTAGEEIAVTASWTAVPDVTELTGSITVESDTAAAASHPLAIAVAETYASWSHGLAEPGRDDDPDGDRWVNSLEYAFGGPPLSGSFLSGTGTCLQPLVTKQGGTASLSFPERLHAELLGISYQVETASTLDGNPWTDALPAGAISSTEPFDPAVPGFVRRTITWPTDGPEKYARVRVTLPQGNP